MIVGLTIILTALVVGLIAGLTRSAGHEIRNDEEIFKYQRGRLRVLLACVPGMAVLTVCAYFLADPRPTGEALYPYLMIGATSTVGMAFLYRYLQSYSITADKNGLRVAYLNKEKFIDYDSIKKVTLVEGGKGGFTLSAFDNRGGRLLTVSDSFEDILGLSGLIRAHAGKFGLVYSHRDRWGKWT